MSLRRPSPRYASAASSGSRTSPVSTKSCHAKAREEAADTLDKVRAAMKINYFDDAALIAEQAARYKAGK